MPLGEISLYTGKVEAVNAAQVQDFSRRRFDPARASVLVAGDGKAFAGPLKAKLPNLTVIPAADLDLDSATLVKPGK